MWRESRNAPTGDRWLFGLDPCGSRIPGIDSMGKERTELHIGEVQQEETIRSSEAVGTAVQETLPIVTPMRTPCDNQRTHPEGGTPLNYKTRATLGKTGQSRAPLCPRHEKRDIAVFVRGCPE